MAIVLKVTPEVLTRMAGDIETQIGDIESQFAAVETEINRTKSFWEGDASDSHRKQYETLKMEIEETISRLKNHPANLLQMAGLYTDTETTLETAAASLSADVIV